MVQTPAPAGGGVQTVAVGFVLAVKVLPIIIFMASLMAVLYHLGVMQRVVALLARGLTRTMHISGAEALSTVGDIFLGMTEAPLLIRPYVARMTESELFAVMCAGMATIAGSVLLAYVAMGVSAGYLVTASFMSAPAAVMFAKIMVPETGTPETSWSAGAARVAVPRLDVNVIDAAARGAGEGLQLALNVGGMLIAFVALVSMLDHGVASVGGLARPPRAEPRPDPRRAAHAAGLRDGRALERGAAGRLAARHQDRAQRVHRLPGDDQPRRRAVAAEHPHRQLRAVRVRQLRLAGDRARRARRHGPRAPQGPGAPGV